MGHMRHPLWRESSANVRDVLILCVLYLPSEFCGLKPARHSAYQWLPLESNPEVVSTFSHRMGASPLWKVLYICLGAPPARFR